MESSFPLRAYSKYKILKGNWTKRHLKVKNTILMSVGFADWIVGLKAPKRPF